MGSLPTGKEAVVTIPLTLEMNDSVVTPTDALFSISLPQVTSVFPAYAMRTVFSIQTPR